MALIWQASRRRLLWCQDVWRRAWGDRWQWQDAAEGSRQARRRPLRELAVAGTETWREPRTTSQSAAPLSLLWLALSSSYGPGHWSINYQVRTALACTSPNLHPSSSIMHACPLPPVTHRSVRIYDHGACISVPCQQAVVSDSEQCTQCCYGRTEQVNRRSSRTSRTKSLFI